MTPMQAIVSATKTASECIHIQKDAGTLERGKIEDLLIDDGDPLAGITLLQDKAKLALIMQGGKIHKNAM